MSESLPEPTLPIFGDRTVSYTVRHSIDDPKRIGEDSHWEKVNISVDEIDTLEDPHLRDVLWEQFYADEKKSGITVFAFVTPDRKFINSARGPRSALNVTFTAEGCIPNDELERHRAEQAREAKEIKTGSWLQLLFRKK